MQYLSGRNDKFANSIVERTHCVPEIVAAVAQYHRVFISRMYHALTVEGMKIKRPTTYGTK